MCLTDAQVKARELKKQQQRAEDARHQREVPTAAQRAASDSVEHQELQLEAQGGSAVAAAALERLGINPLPVRQTVVAASVRLAPQLTVSLRWCLSSRPQPGISLPKLHLRSICLQVASHWAARPVDSALAGDYRAGYGGPVQLGRPTSASARP